MARSSTTFGEGNKAAAGRGPNKVSTKVKEAIINFLENNVDTIQEDFDKLKPRERLQFVADILSYATPKLSAVQSENETKLSGGIYINWQEPDIHNPEDKGSA